MYKYEMHCHTSESSGCGKVSGAEMAEIYKDIGYSGLIITDHFFNGNTAVPKKLPWEERINLFCRGFEEAKKRGEEIGLSVFFAWENSYRGTDFVTYGLNKEWLLRNKYCDLLPAKQYIELARSDGGYVVQAHPYREAGYIDMIRLLPRDVDAVETINACCNDFENAMADFYAENYQITKICGTDNHTGRRERMTALEFDFEAKSVKEIISAIKAGKHTISLYDLN